MTRRPTAKLDTESSFLMSMTIPIFKSQFERTMARGTARLLELVVYLFSSIAQPGPVMKAVDSLPEAGLGVAIQATRSTRIRITPLKRRVAGVDG